MIQDLDHDSVSLHMRARPEDVYALVADVTRTPEFSPEILRCTWLDGADGPAVGARFEAGNKGTRGPARENRPGVTAAKPGRGVAVAPAQRVSRPPGGRGPGGGA